MTYQGVEYNGLCLEERTQVSTGTKKKNVGRSNTRNLKLRRNEKELEREDDKPTSIIEGHNSEDDSDKLPDVQL